MNSQSESVPYEYPDRNDSITFQMISQIEPYPNYWALSERLVLNRIMERLNTMAFRGCPSRFLDAGCGDGRLLPVFANRFAYGMAIDPDSKRVKQAIQTAEQYGIAGKMTFEKSSINEFISEWQFDFILCSHVIQHVRTDIIIEVFQRMKACLAPGGLLAITTTHSLTDVDFFAREVVDNGVFREERISREEFNVLASNGTGVLPIHYFSRKTVRDLLAGTGCKEVDTFSFHCFGNFGDLEQFAHRDLIVNAIPILQDKFGRDFYLGAVSAD